MGGHSRTCPTAGERSIYPLRSSEDDPKTSLNQHQSLSGEILPHFDINNLSVAQKLNKPKCAISSGCASAYCTFGLAPAEGLLASLTNLLASLAKVSLTIMRE